MAGGNLSVGAAKIAEAGPVEIARLAALRVGRFLGEGRHGADTAYWE